jgi:hypothetical protein
LKNGEDKKKLQKKRLLNEILSKEANSTRDKVTNLRLSRQLDKARFEAAFKTLLKK